MINLIYTHKPSTVCVTYACSRRVLCFMVEIYQTCTPVATDYFCPLDRCCIEALQSEYANDYEMQLVKKVMADYKSKVEVRPVARNDEPIIVNFDLAYTQLIDLVSQYK